ncbi:hypothetical protein CFOL_v3_00587 [Cephalotus follicularis]|uniref:Uncharacterized protein n=1 Tax=Cephalotus follicularis TaxID=3775 RepID=A0A1Q3AMR7_CEPFO|nr:hypothetical protein CFOL_v3_00587 [Cephalotus follicularis]
MTIFIQSLDYNLWYLIVDGPNLPTVTLANGNVIPKPRNTYDDNDRRRVQINAKAKHIIICAINSNTSIGFRLAFSPKKYGIDLRSPMKGQIKSKKLRLAC